MKQKIIFILSVTLLLVTLNIKFVNAHSGDTVYAYFSNSPIIDGIINPAEWSVAGTVRFPNSTDTVTAYFLHDGSSLFIALNIPDNTNNSFDDSGFNIDAAHNDGTSCQSDDFLFRMNRAGDDKREGHGPGMFPGDTPTGWIVAVNNVTGGWQVEYKFNFTKFGIPINTQYTMGLFIHTWDDAVGSDFDNWPSGDIYFQPNIWADIIISVTTAVTENHNPKNEIKVFPNPSNNFTTLQFSNPENKNHILIIYNAKGHVVQKIENITDTEVRVENKNRESGLYFFQLQNHTGIAGQGRFIIE
ncbi:MAG: T9SS type A sorting domain-containing protein [Bacteroidia bacterium]|nr:T9SS type A sorting domain-containing protein [Bacteroidia bacterium]